jgi:hypothetical protein
MSLRATQGGVGGLLEDKLMSVTSAVFARIKLACWMTRGRELMEYSIGCEAR